MEAHNGPVFAEFYNEYALSDRSTSIDPISRRSFFTRLLQDYASCAYPKGLYTSLSHSGAYCACCRSRTRVGVDIEKFRDIQPPLIPPGFSTNPRIFLSQWTTLESYVKYTGEGLGENLAPVSTEARGVIFKQFYHGGYVISVCTGADGEISEQPEFVTYRRLLGMMKTGSMIQKNLESDGAINGFVV